ncbi:MAG TPA: hypothetical protein ENM97_06975 [Moorella mulderi]|nr:hypothetical protein [Moorella mulderi]
MKRGWKILAGILAGLLFLYFVFLPQWRDYKQVRQDLEKIQRELEGDRRLIANLPRERERLEVLRQDPVIKRLSLDLREGVDVILLGLQASARNVKITGFEPGLPEEGKALIALPFKFQVESNYPAIFSLVESLEAGGLRNMAEIRNLKLTAGTVPGTLTGEMEVLVYMCRDARDKLTREEMGADKIGKADLFSP